MKKFLLLLLLEIICIYFAQAQEYEFYISDAGNFQNPPWQILKFDQNGQNGEVFINDHLGWPQDIVFLEHKNQVLISNLNTDNITIHNSDSGAYIGEFANGIPGPTRMAIGPDSILYVLPWKGNNKVLRFTLEGERLANYTDTGIGSSIGMAWDGDENFYVSSYLGKTVHKFNSQGTSLGVIISSGLAGPTNIWFNEDDELFVVDYSGGSVKKYNKNGTPLGNFITGIANGEGIALLPDGTIAIGSGGSSAVNLYDSDGSFVKNLIPAQTLNLKTPNAVVLRSLTSSQAIEITKEASFVQPAVGRIFTIQNNIGNITLDNVSIFNEAGMKVHHTKLESTRTWEADKMPKGIYFIHGSSANGKTFVQKIIVN